MCHTVILRFSFGIKMKYCTEVSSLTIMPNLHMDSSFVACHPRVVSVNHSYLSQPGLFVGLARVSFPPSF